jgi:uncharacterized protein YecE (DUF72 family)
MFAGDPGLYIGTSSWSSTDWVGPFYPPGLKPEQFIEHYATVFDTVEVDATYYRPPTRANVDSWRRRTPEGFTFALKTPGHITHELALLDADDEMDAFLEVASGLGSRLGPVLLQFPYFNKKAFASAAPFLERLDRFLGRLPREVRFAVEIRNERWIKSPLVSICRQHGAALVWNEQTWMPAAADWPRLTGGPTADFAYIRWLGDRKAIEKLTQTWGDIVIDQKAATEAWVPVVSELRAAQIKVFGYFNNHFAGHAPASVEMFRRVLEGVVRAS